MIILTLDYESKFKLDSQAFKEIEYAKELVIKDMTEMNLSYWDRSDVVNPEEHFNNIVNWCKENVYRKVWSNKKSVKYGWSYSYGAKHRCEDKLKCYVANNWIKLAMIYAGLDVAVEDMLFDDYCKPTIQDCLTNHINFVCKRQYKKSISDVIDVIGDNYKNIQYNRG